MITPKFVNIYARIGDDYTEDLYVKDFNNVAIDLTGYTISANFSNSILPPSSINSSMVHVTPITATISDAINGKINLTISSTNINTYSMGRYFLQVNVTHTATNKVYRIFEGILTINP